MNAPCKIKDEVSSISEERGMGLKNVDITQEDFSFPPQIPKSKRYFCIEHFTHLG